MDRFIIGVNSSGKTRQMLMAAKESGAVVICKNKYSMANKANAYEIYGLQFMQYEETNPDILFNKKIAIDEIGEFFQYLYGAKLDGFTMTVD